MLIAGIKSRPLYKGLEPVSQGQRHLVAAEGEGALAVLDLAQKASPGFLSSVTILYAAAGSAGQDHQGRLRALAVDGFHLFPTIATLLFRLDGMLSTATMGTRLHAAGTEGFIGQIIQLGLAHGIDHRSILAEHRGSLARRVQCVHCKGVTENVTTNIARCVHCGVSMLVRDHYSRRLGAFMGVSADAEAMGELPPIEEIFP
jgi:hypothetical protein